MALGSATAAIVGGVASIGGGLLGASAQKKSAKKAAKAQIETARMNNELAREFRAENTQNLAPFMQRGDVAGAYINALLGMPDSYYVNRGPDGQPLQPEPPPGSQAQNQIISIPGGGQVNLKDFLAHQRARQQGGAQGGVQGAQGAQGPLTTAVTPVTAGNAFDAYRNSTGYQFRVGQGMDALNTGYAAQGALRSGAAQKDVMEFGQGIASDEFGRYLGYLGNQQGVGLQGASAVAGVSQNALNAMSQNNQNAADARSNASLISGLANQNMWAGIGKSVGNMFTSSFGGIGGGMGGGGNGFGPNAIDNTWR